MKLCIITPTLPERPLFLKRCIDSIDSQFRHTWSLRHLVCGDGFRPPHNDTAERAFLSVDPKCGSWGYPIRNRLLRLADVTNSDYVIFVDDDNILFPGALHKLEDRIVASPPDIVFSKMLWVRDKFQAVFPAGAVTDIRKSNVGTLNYCVRSVIASQCEFGMEYEGDWTFIERCLRQAPNVVYIDELLAAWCSDGL